MERGPRASAVMKKICGLSSNKYIVDKIFLLVCGAINLPGVIFAGSIYIAGSFCQIWIAQYDATCKLIM